MEESLEAKQFREEYEILHAACPFCGCLEYLSSHNIYEIKIESKYFYRDMNDCICTDCSKPHKKHQRVKK